MTLNLVTPKAVSRASRSSPAPTNSTVPPITELSPAVGQRMTSSEIRDSRPRFDATSVWVPTAALAGGDFSAYLAKVKIYDPLTGTFNSTTGAVTNRTAFTNNIIPANRISPIAKAVLPFMGSPKGGPAPGFLINGNIFDSTLAEKTRQYDNFTIKID